MAPSDIALFRVGESCTGKEVVDLHIQGLSQCGGFPFVKLSCATLAPESIEKRVGNSENGHSEERGKSAGTLFFDEIGDLDVDCQRHLLHLLPDGNGLPASQSLAGRIITCTTRDMESEVQNGTFQTELIYRLT